MIDMQLLAQARRTSSLSSWPLTVMIIGGKTQDVVKSKKAEARVIIRALDAEGLSCEMEKV